MKDKTVKQLREMAVKLGMPKEDAESFDKKAPLIATINILKATKATKVKKVKTLNPPPNPKEEKKIEKQWRSKAERMRAKLDAQPQIRFMIPLEGEEKSGVVREVMVKGRKEYIHVSGHFSCLATVKPCNYLVFIVGVQ